MGVQSPFRRTAMLLPVALLAATIGRAAEPAPAAVFIRVLGTLSTERQRAWTETTEVRDVEVATGSGFVVSPSGYVLTNHHVVSGDERTVYRHGQPVRVRVEVTSVEVVFPADGTRLEARVQASDADLDLAVLSVGGHDLPFIALGDSDALQAGHPVQVVGFPYGRAVEVGRDVGPDTVPQASVSRGTVAALRQGDEGDARYIQTDASVYPGNSGGPMLDEEGYAVGVVRMKLTRGSGAAAGPAFAIPVNRVKDFLESSGLDGVFPARRLALGPVQSLDWKGLRFRAPEGFDDSSRTRLRAEWAPPQEVALLVDRVASPLGLAELEGRLLAGRDFTGPGAVEARGARAATLAGRAARIGRGRALSASGTAVEIGYALVDAGAEKVVARYVGAADHVAFNRSVLEGWLESLEVDPLLSAEAAAPVRALLEPAALPHPLAPGVLLPHGWSREPAGPGACDLAEAADAVLSSSPEGDFTISMRAAWWQARGADLERELATCLEPRPGDGSASYAVRSTRLGVPYVREGVLLPAGGGLLHLEMETPASKRPLVEELLASWIGGLAGQDPR
ncbi:MAG TPA: trypsin-like peptidase domain-containing protein [Vicinamibacteria bacterium]|nr:trypsin-like peptidase domain-containing protein [Vicinamibacteria bacterium]